MEIQIVKKVEGDDIYTIQHIKSIEDVEGNTVRILERTEDTTIRQLEEKKQGLQQQIDVLNEKIAEIDTFIEQINLI